MHCMLCIAFYALYSMHFTLLIVFYALYSMHCFYNCILCNIFYELYFRHCIGGVGVNSPDQRKKKKNNTENGGHYICMAELYNASGQCMYFAQTK
jgi:hypothetical protein